MPIINPEVIAFARVRVEAYPNAFYEFSNGFDSVSVLGTPYGSPVFGWLSPSTIVLFLSEPVGPGEIVVGPSGDLSSEGGVKARIDLVQTSTPLSPSPALLPQIEARWYYREYQTALIQPPGVFASVDPQKMIVVGFFLPDGAEFDGPKTFDIAVFRNPMTRYKPPTIYGVTPNVVVYPAP